MERIEQELHKHLGHPEAAQVLEVIRIYNNEYKKKVDAEVDALKACKEKLSKRLADRVNSNTAVANDVLMELGQRATKEGAVRKQYEALLKDMRKQHEERLKDMTTKSISQAHSILSQAKSLTATMLEIGRKPKGVLDLQIEAEIARGHLREMQALAFRRDNERHYLWNFGGPGHVEGGRAQYSSKNFKPNDNSRNFTTRLRYAEDCLVVLHDYFNVEYPMDIPGNFSITLPPDFMFEDPEGRRAGWWSGRIEGDAQTTTVNQLFQGGEYSVFYKTTWANFKDSIISGIRKHRPVSTWVSLHRFTESKYDDKPPEQMVPLSEHNQLHRQLLRERRLKEALEREIAELKRQKTGHGAEDTQTASVL